MASGERSLIGRAFIVLGAFDAKSPRLTQSEISRRSGLPLPTVHRLCGQLVAEGALERRSDGKYQVGVRLWEIGALAPGAHGLRQVALPFLEDLYEVTRENVQLVVREGTEALYLERLSSRSAVTVVGRAGGKIAVARVQRWIDSPRARRNRASRRRPSRRPRVVHSQNQLLPSGFCEQLSTRSGAPDSWSVASI